MRDSEINPTSILAIAILFLVSLLLAASCNTGKTKDKPEYPMYQIGYTNEVPDSLKDDMARFIVELTRASNQHLAAGDFEEVEDVIEQAEETAENIYERKVPVLHVKNSYADGWNCKREYTLTPQEKEIFKKLINTN